MEKNSNINNILLVLIGDNTSLDLRVEGLNLSQRLFNVQEAYEFNTYSCVLF